MDWQGTNFSPAVTWSDMQARADVPYEDMIRLCNALDADMWLCMPHLANDDAVRTLAELVRDRLEPDRRVYVEWSNEVWNAAFETWHWLKDRELTEAETRDWWHIYADEVDRDWDIWLDVFGDDARVVRVTNNQSASGDAWGARKLAEALDDEGAKFDALAIAPYMHVDRDAIPDNATGQTLIAMLRADLPDLREEIKDNARVAAQYGVPLIAYEGGQHLYAGGKGDDLPWYEAYVAAQRSPAMYDLYRDYLAMWRDSSGGEGGGLFVHFNGIRRIDKWGAWGLFEYQTQPPDDAPKRRAFEEFAAEGSQP